MMFLRAPTYLPACLIPDLPPPTWAPRPSVDTSWSQGSCCVRLEAPVVSPGHGLPCSRTRSWCCALPARHGLAWASACPRRVRCTHAHSTPPPLVFTLAPCACGCSQSTRGQGTQSAIDPTGNAFDFGRLATRTEEPHGACVRRSKRNRLGRHSRHFVVLNRPTGLAQL